MIEKNDCGLVVVKVTGVVRLPMVIVVRLFPARTNQVLVPIHQRWKRPSPRNGNVVVPPVQRQ